MNRVVNNAEKKPPLSAHFNTFTVNESKSHYDRVLYKKSGVFSYYSAAAAAKGSPQTRRCILKGESVIMLV